MTTITATTALQLLLQRACSVIVNHKPHKLVTEIAEGDARASRDDGGFWRRRDTKQHVAAQNEADLWLKGLLKE